MSENRVFVSQETLDRWLSEERVEVSGDVLTLQQDGQRFQLATALHFLSEVAGGGDPQSWLGKVKQLESIIEAGGEHVSGSVLLGESAFEVIEGFIGLPIHDAASSLAAAAQSALGEAPPRDDIDQLARFFMGSR
jgi:hypothetical protein